MPLAADQFIYPHGLLHRDWFPDDSLDAAVATWLDDGLVAVADLEAAIQERAQKAYVYAMGFQAAANRFQAEPIEQTLDSGKTRMKRDVSQTTYFVAQANQFLREYREYFQYEAAEFVAIGG